MRAQHTTATVWVPAKDGSSVTESSRPAGEAPEVEPLAGDSKGAAVFEVAFGSYAFRSTI